MHRRGTDGRTDGWTDPNCKANVIVAQQTVARELIGKWFARRSSPPGSSTCPPPPNLLANPKARAEGGVIGLHECKHETFPPGGFEVSFCLNSTGFWLKCGHEAREMFAFIDRLGGQIRQFTVNLDAATGAALRLQVWSDSPGFGNEIIT